MEEKLAVAATETRARFLCLEDETKMEILRHALAYKPEIFTGEEGLREIACLADVDMVLVAIVGTGGLRPALAAIEAGKDLAAASKEILVMAGEIVMREARDNRVHVLPVDSEHNAIFQCLEGRIQGSEFRVQNEQRITGSSETCDLEPEPSDLIRRIIL